MEADEHKKWSDFAHSLIGKATLDEEEQELMDELLDTDGAPEILDGIAFCCSDCGWWCEISEESSEEVGRSEFICSDCAEEDV